MEDLGAEAFLADKAYNTNELLDMLREADITAVIPPVKSRKEQRAYSHELYRARHVIENVFRALKRRRGIAAPAHSSPLPSLLPFMSGARSSTFQSTLPRCQQLCPLAASLRKQTR
ncbi:transposase [Treponema endosymbiont of Eucomonympha sp.]|uniref:transposase n=1 Tax=Treponema endosymbiont of Eucomonympha sp. TaxID=1580831 RepID=UPI000782CA6D|nr:transposase [Treponema endosymbiont of Eucomonympha sp.]